MTVGRLVALVLAFAVLVMVLLGMHAASQGPVELGPYPTGDGDAVTVAPRAAP